MKSKNIAEILKKQHYAILGENEHSALQICRWTKRSLTDEGFCYKQKFYGIKSHLCCQMSPNISCENKCLHCWRPVELDFNVELKDKPEQIIEDSIKMQRKMLNGFKGNKKINMKKYQEAQNPSQFAISLIGEPTMYPYLGDLIEELKKQNKTSFVVTNGLHPDKLKKLSKKNKLPTQLYISLNTPNEKMYNSWHRSKSKDAWKKFNQSLQLFKELKKKTRTVIRMTLVKDMNMKDEHVSEYCELIKKASPMFIEVKSFMSVGFSRKRIAYEKMPSHKEIVNYSNKIEKHLNSLGEKYKILDEKKESRVVVLGKNKKDLKIKF